MNILFAFADDWGRYAQAYKEYEGESSINEIIMTPNFDKVAKEGALFLNANVPAPSCTPCRSSILSGKYFWQTGLGAILQGAVWDTEIETYPLILEKFGYHIGYTYKVWSPGKNPDAPYGGKRTEYQTTDSRFGQIGKYSYNVMAEAKKIGLEKAKANIRKEVLDNFNAFLDDRPEGKPFCYWWGPTTTHRPWLKGSGKKIWGIDPDSLKGRMPSFFPDVDEIREDFSDYLGECQAVDEGLGVLLGRLEEIGELDNTLVVVSGDHGIPGMPRGKCNLYNIGCEVALAMRWPNHIKAGTIIDNMVNLMDLAPTFLDVAGCKIPKGMAGKSLLPILNGSFDKGNNNDFVVTGRERHVMSAREGCMPYPQRSIRTKDYLYIVNFEPDRWPMGDPCGCYEKGITNISYEEIESNTRIAFADMDAGPTKAWMVTNRNEESVWPLFEKAFGKRPKEELYDLKKDPDYMNNVSNVNEYAKIKEELKAKLLEELIKYSDPRIVEESCRFESSPYSGELTDFQKP